MKTEEKTLTDRVATLLSFKLAIQSNRFLHNVRIKPSVTGPDGKQIAIGGELSVPSAPYDWVSDKTVDIILDVKEPVFTLKLEMTSDETGPVQWSAPGK